MNRLLSFPYGFRGKLCLIVFAVALLTASVVSGREWFRSSEDVSSPAPLSQTVSLNVSQVDKRPAGVEAEVITILSSGFQPAEITRPRGQFLILVDNQSGLDDLTLRLQRVGGQKLNEVRQTRKERIVRQVENLPPGEYQLTEAEHPDWVCRITITP